MQAVTLIGLMLSLFGGAYSAISALRAHFDVKIAGMNALAITCMQVIKDGNIDASIKATTRLKGGLTLWTRIWFGAQLLPTVLFLCFAFFMALWSVIFWDQLTKPQDWWVWKHIVMWGAALNLLSVLFAIVALIVCKKCYAGLDEHYNAENQRKATAIEPVRAAAAAAQGDGP